MYACIWPSYRNANRNSQFCHFTIVSVSTNVCTCVCVSQVMRRGVMDRGSVKGRVHNIFYEVHKYSQKCNKQSL